jgi:hypothetical protein
MSVIANSASANRAVAMAVEANQPDLERKRTLWELVHRIIFFFQRQIRLLQSLRGIVGGLIAALLLCSLLIPALAQQQGNIWGDPWQNAPWHGVSNWPGMQYRWIGGGSAGSATIWGGCKVQLRTTDGSRPTVQLNVYFKDGDGPTWWHLPNITVSQSGFTAADPIDWGILNNLQSNPPAHGCLEVTNVEVNEHAPPQ